MTPSPKSIAVAAIKTWRREVEAKTRTLDTVDALWRAACETANGLEIESTLPESATRCYRRAAKHALSEVTV